MGTRVIVYHAGYGCDTGCCGHVVQLVDDTQIDDQSERKRFIDSEFTFSHPNIKYTKTPDDPREWAERLVTETLGEEHVKDLDWDHCVVLDD